MGPGDRETELRRHRERAERVLASDHFTALGLPRTAGAEDAQRAFVEAAKQWHPDRVPPAVAELGPLYARVFSRLELARGTLTDPHRRQKYLDELFASPRGGPPADARAAEASLELRKAEVLLKKGDVQTAERHLRRAVELQPGNIGAQVQLAWLRVKPTSPPAELEGVVAELDRLVLLDGKAERAFFFRGQLRKRLGRDQDAYADFVRAAELDKTNLDAQREVRLYEMRRQKAGASTDKAPAGGVGQFFQRLWKR